MTNLLRTISIFFRNPYINPYWAGVRHLAWQFRKMSNAFPCDIVLDGLRIRIHDRSIANGCGALLNAMGFYDPNNMYFLDEILSKGIFSVFFDIGANIGVYTLLASRQGGIQVISFEPHPYTFSLLKENVVLNHISDRVDCLQMALGKDVGQIYFSNVPGSPVNHVLTHEGATGVSKILVNVTRGDVFCSEHGLVPEIMKLDVEGFEDSVLEGFGKILDEVRVIIVECLSVEKTSQFLRDSFRFLGPFKLDFRTRKFTGHDTNYEDWIFLKAETADLLRQSGYRFDK